MDIERTALLISRGELHGARGGEETTFFSCMLENGLLTPALLAEAKSALRIEEECTIALPSSLLALRVFSLPSADEESLASIARLQMEKLAPFSGEQLAFSHEIIADDGNSARVIAAAAPMSVLDELAAQFREASLKIARIDAALLSWWRQLLAVEEFGKTLRAGRVVVLFNDDGAWDLVVADRGMIRFVRGLGVPPTPEDLAQETQLSLLNLEFENCDEPLSGLMVVCASDCDASWIVAVEKLLGFSAARVDKVLLGCPAEGTLLREISAADSQSAKSRLDLIPAAWRRAARDAVARHRAFFAFSAAIVLWILIVAGLWIAPKIVSRRTDAINARIASISTRYRMVSDVRKRVRLIRSYQDRSHSFLDVFRFVCEKMPESGMVFSSVTYDKGRLDDAKQSGGIKLSGEANAASMVYAFKDEFDNSEFFSATKLTGPTLDGSRSRHRFELDVRFKQDSEAGK